MRALAIVMLACCTRAGSPALDQNAKPVEERCGMIEAALRSAEITDFACGEAATQDGRLIVDVDIEPPLSGDCTSSRFAPYRDDQPMNTDALLQLAFSARGQGTWAVGASFIDPPNSPDDASADGSFEDNTYYCHVMGVRVSRDESGWRTSNDPSW